MPDFSYEKQFKGFVAGVDEAGRGPWAGPVVAAAVIFQNHQAPIGINDSKKLSAAKREALFDAIMETGIVGVGISSVEEIDSLNILGATKLAMQRAVENLSVTPNAVLVDGNQPPKLSATTRALIKGDSLSISIAAASIIAKVTRDRMMQELHAKFPHYGWARNAGYGTAAHIKALAEHGITPHHRKSFRPIKDIIYGQAA